MSRAREKTKISKIFENTYWGNFDKDESITDVIIQNRNKFIESNNIVRCTTSPPDYILRETNEIDKNNKTTASRRTYFDHTEYYLDNNKNYVLISSPYGEYDEEYIKLGWISVDKLYNTYACTYMKCVQSKINNNNVQI